MNWILSLRPLALIPMLIAAPLPIMLDDNDADADWVASLGDDGTESVPRNLHLAVGAFTRRNEFDIRINNAIHEPSGAVRFTDDEREELTGLFANGPMPCQLLHEDAAGYIVLCQTGCDMCVLDSDKAAVYAVGDSNWVFVLFSSTEYSGRHDGIYSMFARRSTCRWYRQDLAFSQLLCSGYAIGQLEDGRGECTLYYTGRVLPDPRRVARRASTDPRALRRVHPGGCRVAAIDVLGLCPGNQMQCLTHVNVPAPGYHNVDCVQFRTQCSDDESLTELSARLRGSAEEFGHLAELRLTGDVAVLLSAQFLNENLGNCIPDNPIMSFRAPTGHSEVSSVLPGYAIAGVSISRDGVPRSVLVSQDADGAQYQLMLNRLTRLDPDLRRCLDRNLMPQPDFAFRSTEFVDMDIYRKLHRCVHDVASWAACAAGILDEWRESILRQQIDPTNRNLNVLINELGTIAPEERIEKVKNAVQKELISRSAPISYYQGGRRRGNELENKCRNRINDAAKWLRMICNLNSIYTGVMDMSPEPSLMNALVEEFWSLPIVPSSSSLPAGSALYSPTLPIGPLREESHSSAAPAATAATREEPHSSAAPVDGSY